MEANANTQDDLREWQFNQLMEFDKKDLALMLLDDMSKEQWIAAGEEFAKAQAEGA